VKEALKEENEMLHRLARVWPARTGRWVLVLMAACSLGLAGNAYAQPAAQIEKDEIGSCSLIGGGVAPCIDSESPGEFSQEELDGIAALDPELVGIVDRGDCALSICDTTLACGDRVRSVLTMENQGAADSEAFYLVQAYDIVNPGDADEFVIPNAGSNVLPADLPAGCDSSDPSNVPPPGCPGVDHLPIAAANGNTDCLPGGDLPCTLCPAGADSTTNPECSDDLLLDAGRIIFLSNEYDATEADAGAVLGNRAGTNRYAACDGLGGCSEDISAVLEDVGFRTIECEGRLQNYKCYSAKPEPGTGFVQTGPVSRTSCATS
jgi:hypothetical protein